MVRMARCIAHARSVAVGVSAEVRRGGDEQHGKESDTHDFCNRQKGSSQIYYGFDDGDDGFSGEGGACMASRHVVSRVSNTVRRESSSCTKLSALLLFGVSLLRLVCPYGVVFVCAAGGSGRGVAGT